MTTKYEWKIFKKTSQGAWEEVTDSDYATMLSTRRDGQTLAVKAFTLTGGVTYKFRLESWVGNAKTRGYSEYIKEVNRPPHQGTCLIASLHSQTPDTGFAFQKDFRITSAGWQDDTKLKYTVTARVAYNQPEITVPAEAVLSVGQAYTSPLLELPAGQQKYGFWIDVFVRVEDEDGASTTVRLKVRVRKKKN